MVKKRKTTVTASFAAIAVMKHELTEVVDEAERNREIKTSDLVAALRDVVDDLQARLELMEEDLEAGRGE